MTVAAVGVIGYIFLLASLNVGLRYTGAILVACGIYPNIPLVGLSHIYMGTPILYSNAL